LRGHNINPSSESLLTLFVTQRPVHAAECVFAGHQRERRGLGPCECDIYLTCPKFFTTPEYAPRALLTELDEVASPPA
jgi:hypothetical protein